VIRLKIRLAFLLSIFSEGADVIPKMGVFLKERLTRGRLSFDDLNRNQNHCHARFTSLPDSPVMFERLFSERGLSLDRLKVLIEVRDAGSIAQAAPSDPVRQSQYSRQLRELSEFFGCEVTQRKGKLLKLTSKGERLAELARDQLRSLEDFRAECTADRVVFTIGAGDSLIQWLVIPKLGAVVREFAHVHFATSNLRTNDIVQQLTEGRLDFGIIRKNALAHGLRSESLGYVRYAALVPYSLLGSKKKTTLVQLLSEMPLAAQTTDGQFASGLREIAKAKSVAFTPTLSCESFPQTMAALRSGQFAAVVPEIALRDLPANFAYRIEDATLKKLDREAMLAWNPRLVRVRPNAATIAAKLKEVLKVRQNQPDSAGHRSSRLSD
jgi:DNA-binding transcriptional LysR family regulator